MYQTEDKQFSHKSIAEIEDELATVLASNMQVRRIFLADGDVMTLSVRRLAEILKAIKKTFPDVQRISAYCLPRNLLQKSVAELKTLHTLGLQLLYVGCESGDKTVFRSEHASNYLVLKGVLGRDKEKLIQQVEMAINHPSKINIRQESQRGL